MTCVMRLHDPCAGEVRLRKVYGHDVPLCWRHSIRLHLRESPFRWQSVGQLALWAAAKRLKAPASTTPTGARSLRVTRKQSSR